MLRVNNHIVNYLADLAPVKPEIQWDTSRPTGDKVRILSTQRAKDLLNFEAKTSLREGINKTIEWYLENTDVANRRGRELHG